MSNQPRILEKFTSIDGSTLVATFPLAAYEMEEQQSLRIPSADIAGSNYPIDLLGTGLALKSAGEERVRCEVLGATPAAVDSTFDTLKSNCYNIGLGKLWRIDSASVEQWCYARIVNMLPISWKAGWNFKLATELVFRRQSNWYGAAQSSSAAATGTVVVNNPGGSYVYDGVFTLYGTYTNPVITNTSVLVPNTAIAYKLQTNRDGVSSAQRVRFSSGLYAAEYSSDSGGIWADDMANFVRQPLQVQMMVLKPGNNSFTFTGITSATFAWAFFAQYD